MKKKHEAPGQLAAGSGAVAADERKAKAAGLFSTTQAALSHGEEERALQLESELLADLERQEGELLLAMRRVRVIAEALRQQVPAARPRYLRPLLRRLLVAVALELGGALEDTPPLREVA
jgi:hypothetical protein